MKKIIKKEMYVCDICTSSDSIYTHCKECGKDFCYECRKDNTVEYPHSVHCTGSGDGTYCNQCDAKLKKSGNNELYNWYQKIKRLRAKKKKIYADIESEIDWAELQVQAALGR